MVEVPINAVVEDGNESIVFVQDDAKEPVFTMRRVEVTNRFDDTAYVRSTPPVQGRKGGRNGRAGDTAEHCAAEETASGRGTRAHRGRAGAEDCLGGHGSAS